MRCRGACRGWYYNTLWIFPRLCLCKCIPLCNNFTHKMKMQPQIQTKHDKLNMMLNPHLLNFLVL